MLNVTGAGDSRCLNCKSQKCFVCEHRKTSQELINQGLKDDNKHDFDEDSQNPLFIVSNNITSNFNDSRCLYCRSQHCFQCEHKINEAFNELKNTEFTTIAYNNTTSFNDSSEKNFATNTTTNSNNFTYIDPFLNMKRLKKPIDSDLRCFTCRSKKCFQCEHKLFSYENLKKSESQAIDDDIETKSSELVVNSIVNDSVNEYKNTTSNNTNTNSVSFLYPIIGHKEFKKLYGFSNDLRCFNCRSQRCFQCEHKNLSNESEEYLKKSENETVNSDSNKPTDLTKTDYFNTTSFTKNISNDDKNIDASNTNKTNINTKKFTFVTKEKKKLSSTSNVTDLRCFNCRSQKCFLCEHRPVPFRAKPLVPVPVHQIPQFAEKRPVFEQPQPVRSNKMNNENKNQEKSSCCCCCC